MVALTLAMKTFETRVVGGDTLEPYEATEAFNPLAFIFIRARTASCSSRTLCL
jgi:hypothetical protein